MLVTGSGELAIYAGGASLGLSASLRWTRNAPDSVRSRGRPIPMGSPSTIGSTSRLAQQRFQCAQSWVRPRLHAAYWRVRHAFNARG